MSNSASPGQQWAIEVIDWRTQGTEPADIRARVFIEEQHVTQEEEWDGLDSTATHFLVKTADQTPVGTARLLPSGQVGRMAILKPYRGLGVGAALLGYIIAWSRSHALPPLFLHAQVRAIPFYEKLGFTVTGPEFLDAGIRHREMHLHHDTENR